MSIKDKERISHFTPSFPLSFETVLQTITQVFADKQLKKLEEGFDDVREQIDNTITHINHLNLKTLTNEEIYNLSKILHSNSKKCLAAE